MGSPWRHLSTKGMLASFILFFMLKNIHRAVVSNSHKLVSHCKSARFYGVKKILPPKNKAALDIWAKLPFWTSGLISVILCFCVRKRIVLFQVDNNFPPKNCLSNPNCHRFCQSLRNAVIANQRQSSYFVKVCQK